MLTILMISTWVGILNIEYLIKTNCTSYQILTDKLKIPKFWAQVFAYFNECKTLRPYSNTSNYNFLSALLWFNEQIKFKNKPIFLANWSKSNILYVKDLFPVQGQFVSENIIFGSLVNKQNWIQEYSLVKNILKEILKDHDFDTNMARHINIRPIWSILVQNSYHYIKTQKSTFYYNILVQQKFTKNYMEDVWEINLNINKPNWRDIYQRKIWVLQDKKLAEFNYKVLCNILCTRSRVFKWNKDLDDKCPYCNEVQNVKHLLFDCRRVKNLWAIVGDILKLDIKYKHLILGDNETNSFIKSRNLIINYIQYAIYKHWIMSENNKINFSTNCLLSFVKKDLFSRSIYVKDEYFHMLCDNIILNM